LSCGRAQLLNALLAEVHDRRLFCVGDDWQSIYRFAGGDIEQMTKFDSVFGFTQRCDLTITHRFNTELLAASSQFVQANPTQLRKSLKAGQSLGEPAIEVLAKRPDDDPEQFLDRAFARVAEHATREWTAPAGVRDAKPTVLVLGRYNFTKRKCWDRIVRRHARLTINFLTVHRAKGLEADYVIVLDVIRGRMGFPSELADDPILDLVLAGTGEFPNAEERRVFYVALSRAKKRCLILTDTTCRSKFVEELESETYRAWVIPSESGRETAPRCPECGGGRLLKRDGEYGAFWGCTNYPLCEGKARMCPACKKGALVKEALGFRCQTSWCGHFETLCPSCHQGALIKRSGPYGDFLSCTEWRPEGSGPSCDYKKNLRDGRTGPRRVT